MITKIAFLPRILPGIFRLETVATVGGYRMPHDRYFFYGISVSALLHVAVLYGFPPRTPPPPDVALPVVVPPTVGDYVEIEDPPELPKAPDAKDTPEPDPAPADTGAPRATLGETFRDASDAAFTITTRIAPAVVPNPNSNVWEVPRTPPAGRVKAPKGDMVDWKDLDKKPVATNRIAPNYPSEMKRIGMHGTVVMRFVVDNVGGVSDVEILSADTPEFGKAASDAILRWKFRPGMRNGRRVATRMEMPMVFSLENNT